MLKTLMAWTHGLKRDIIEYSTKQPTIYMHVQLYMAGWGSLTLGARARAVALPVLPQDRLICISATVKNRLR